MSTRGTPQRRSPDVANKSGRRTVRNVAVAVVGVALVLPPALSAGAATEPDISPVNGVFDLQGRGYGHGRGMSQWGAQGAATLGIPYAEILAFYYPGTTLTRVDDSAALRVHITDDNDGDLRVRPAEGLRVRSEKDSRMVPTKVNDHTVSLWRVAKIGGGKLRLYARYSGAWHTVTVDGKRSLTSPVRFRTKPSNGVRIVISASEERDYRGQALAYADASTGGALKVVNKVKMRDYLRSVVPSESFPSWAPAALEAQSVAARTYALWRARNVPLGFADICDTTSCQVYHGARRTDGNGMVTRVWEAASTDLAVLRAVGRILQYGGAPALTEFSASNGGYSTDGKKPYLIAKPDPWDGVVTSNAHSWDNELKASTINTAYPSIGKVTKIKVIDRDGNGPWGGRVLQVKLYGTKKSITVNGFSFAGAVGLRHSWWRSVAVETASPTNTTAPVKAQPKTVRPPGQPTPTPSEPLVAPEVPASPEDPSAPPPASVSPPAEPPVEPSAPSVAPAEQSVEPTDPPVS